MASLTLRRQISFSLLLIIALTMISFSSSDINKDKDECGQQLVGMATCLPYVQGSAKAPTPDCCEGLVQVLKANRKCLCLVVLDRDDPSLSLNINATLALGLPSVCHAAANISQCPELLHLAPNSKDAQIFYQFAHGSKDSSSSPASAHGAVQANPGSSTASTPKNDGCRRWLQIDVTVAVLCLWCFSLILFI